MYICVVYGMYVFVSLHESRCVCDGKDQSGRVLQMLRTAGLSNVIIKRLGEKDSQVHRDKVPCPRGYPAVAQVWLHVETHNLRDALTFPHENHI